MDKGPGKKWYAWTVASPDTVYHRIVPSRSGATAKTVLGDYAGVVMVDGYAAYQTATKSSADGPAPATLAFCGAHVRRKFVEALKFEPACQQVLELIGQLYALEEDLPDWHALEGQAQQDALAHRLAVRQQQSAPLIERIQAWALAQKALPDSTSRKALEYMLHLWRGLTVFLHNPWVPLDNNREQCALSPILTHNFVGISRVEFLVEVDPVKTSKDLLACDKEPIHVPGLIQEHGALLTVALPERVVRQASENLGAVVGLEPAEALGRPLPDLLRLADGSSWASWAATSSEAVRWTRATDPTGRDFDLFAHRRGEVVILEAEPARRWDELALLGFENALHEEVARIQGAGDLETLCPALTDAVARLTGFDRVMVYRFDEAWSGTVIAERRAPGVDSYLGQRFPATDIPPQARALFLSSWLRTVPDVAYTPVPILPTLDPRTGQPLDLSRSLLRSVSPIHIEYLKNMGVGASLTISLLREGRLWGLISCHHRGPRRLGYRERSACELIGRLASAQLGACEARDDIEQRRRFEGVLQRLRTTLVEADDVLAGLRRGAPDLLALADSARAGVAIQSEGQWTLLGATPPADALADLVGWLATAAPDFEVYSTDALPQLYPPAEQWKDVASGLVAISLPKRARDGILWFRPEVVQTVQWAGDPSKPTVPDSRGLRLHPRKSFEIWRETVRNCSLPWEPGVLGAVRELRRSLIELDLQRQFRKERAARQARDHVLGVVSHDLRSPLSVILLGLDELKDGSEQGEVLRSMELAGRRMRSLIEDLLSLAQLEAGTYRLDKTEVGSDELLREALELFQPLAAAKPVGLAAPGRIASHRLRCDRERILQVFSNLVGNAIKFTPAGGHVSLGVEAVDDALVFTVADDGPGIPAEALPHVFDRFWQATQLPDERRQGAGLGLSIVKGIVEAHGGRVWVDSRPGEGSRFYFSVPRWKRSS